MEKIIEDTISKHKIMLDENCKMIVGHHEMLSRIIKGFVEEAKHLSVVEISKLIKDDQCFHRLNNENMIPGYGTIKFDFFVLLIYHNLMVKRNVFI